MSGESPLGALALRPAVMADAATLADLGRRGFIAKFGHMYDADNLERFLLGAHADEVVARELADPDMRIAIAERSGAAISFCKLAMRCGWPDHARGRRVIELKQLYTDPARIGGGAGGALMAWALAEAHAFGADEMQLSVWSDNHDAQRFYARHGFLKIADIEFWVGAHRDDDVLFAAMV